MAHNQVPDAPNNAQIRERGVHRNWQVALDALVEDAPSCGLDGAKVREKVAELLPHYKSDRTKYEVIRHLHDSMLNEANREAL